MNYSLLYFLVKNHLLWGGHLWTNSVERSGYEKLATYQIYSIMLKYCWRGFRASNECFLKISVRRSKYCLEFSIAWGRLKISRWAFHLWTTFEDYLINSLWFSDIQFFTFHSPGLAIFMEERKAKIFGFKNVMKNRRNQKTSRCKTLNCI